MGSKVTMSNPMVTYVATKKSLAATAATVRSQRRRELLDSATPKRPPIIAPTKNPAMDTTARAMENPEAPAART